VRRVSLRRTRAPRARSRPGSRRSQSRTRPGGWRGHGPAEDDIAAIGDVFHPATAVGVGSMVSKPRPRRSGGRACSGPRVALGGRAVRSRPQHRPPGATEEAPRRPGRGVRHGHAARGGDAARVGADGAQAGAGAGGAWSTGRRSGWASLTPDPPCERRRSRKTGRFLRIQMAGLPRARHFGDRGQADHPQRSASNRMANRRV
jgi:hypothetical protein